MTTIIKLRPEKLPEFQFRRKANFTCQFCWLIIQLVNGRSHTPIDENRPFSAALPRRLVAPNSAMREKAKAQ
jgi:hypothetical protein